MAYYSVANRRQGTPFAVFAVRDWLSVAPLVVSSCLVVEHLNYVLEHIHVYCGAYARAHARALRVKDSERCGELPRLKTNARSSILRSNCTHSPIPSAQGTRELAALSGVTRSSAVTVQLNNQSLGLVGENRQGNSCRELLPSSWVLLCQWNCTISSLTRPRQGVSPQVLGTQIWTTRSCNRPIATAKFLGAR
jgi:hypothetical protein